jgi:GNAT superfamily N-acetyltransferase
VALVPQIRPMREDDADAAIELAVVTFEAYAHSRREPPDPRPDPAAVRPRYTDLIRRDPAGAWVAEHDGRLVAAALAIRREDVWGLSLLVVHPDFQSAGLGRELLGRAHAYADGARGRIILSSSDPRALRAYARLGLTGAPCFAASGTPRGVREPAGIRAATPDDQPFLDAVSRHVRGAAHGADMASFRAMGAEILVAPERGYAVLRESGLRQLAAFDAAGAQDLLRAALARARGETRIEWLSERQAWAIPVCLDAGLRLLTDAGAVWLDGDVGPFSPYLPSGAFL